MIKPLVTTTSFLLILGLFGQAYADESNWTELTVPEFKELVLGNTMKGRSSHEGDRYVEYWKANDRKIEGLWKNGEYESGWKPGEETGDDKNCIMYQTSTGYQCWKLIKNENGNLKWKRGYGHGDTHDVIILEGKQLSTDALYADD